MHHNYFLSVDRDPGLASAAAPRIRPHAALAAGRQIEGERGTEAVSVVWETKPGRSVRRKELK